MFYKKSNRDRAICNLTLVYNATITGWAKLFWIIERKRSSGIRRIFTVAFRLRGNHFHLSILTNPKITIKSYCEIRRNPLLRFL